MKNQEIEEKRYPLAEARKIAEQVLEEMKPHCERIEIAGSIRRKKATIGDIEIVAIPKPYSVGIFEDGLAKIVNKWTKVKEEMVYGQVKYTQRILPQGIKLDIFFVTPENWGSQLGIRTGSIAYVRDILAYGWSKNGYKSEGGFLVQDGIRYDVPEEKDVFRMSGVKYVEPEERDL